MKQDPIQILLLCSLIMFVASLGANTEEIRLSERFLGEIFFILAFFGIANIAIEMVIEIANSSKK